MSERERDIIVEDESLAAGYTVIPNLILRNTALSPGAKLAYVMLLSYAWQDESCFPGQATLARDMGASERYVRNALKELAENRFITIEQRGLNRTNRYIIHRIGSARGADQGQQGSSGPARGADQGQQGSSGPARGADQDRHEKQVHDRHHMPTTSTQTDKDHMTIDSGETEIPKNGIAEFASPAPTQLDQFRSMSPEQRLAHFDAEQSRLKRMQGLR